MNIDNKLDFDKVNEGLLEFLDASPNAYFAVDNVRKMLNGHGFTELREQDGWELKAGESYFVTRNGSALIAFRIPKAEELGSAYAINANVSGKHAGTCESHANVSGLHAGTSGFEAESRGLHVNNCASCADIPGFQMMVSHSDSPCFKIKLNAEIEVEDNYIKLNTEKYGGMLMAPWFDRPLSVAGRVVADTGDGVEVRLVNIDRDLLIIPNLAIHMNREANDGYKYNAQVDMLPLCGDMSSKGGFKRLIAEAAGVDESSLLDADLYLYNRMKGTRLGINNEFIASGRLDDLQCAYASIMGLIGSEPKGSIALCCIYDNEEVGSGTKQGAASTFLKDTMARVLQGLRFGTDILQRSIAKSFMVSADNAHSVHPNHTDKADPTNRPYMNKGIVIKYSANQKYTTDAVSGAIFRKLCDAAGVPYQSFANRADMPGGSTLGNISTAQVAVNTVDVGLAELAMHSPYETAGAFDTAYLIEAAKALFSSTIECDGDAVRVKLIRDSKHERS